MLLSHGELFIDSVIGNEGVVVALACYIHSPIKAIQEPALHAVSSLYKNRPNIAKFLFVKGKYHVHLHFKNFVNANIF